MRLLQGFTAVALASTFIAGVLSTTNITYPPFPQNLLTLINLYTTQQLLITQADVVAGVDRAELDNFINSISLANFSSLTQPNPIRSTFPSAITESNNGTFIILPIDYSLAREVIPQQYAILNESIQAVLPDFPPGKYPVISSLKLILLPRMR